MSTPSSIAIEAVDELHAALAKYGPMLSAHEGWAVIFEEVDELWDEVKLKPSQVSKERMRKEAIQVAAMAMRFVLDVCDKP